MNLSSLAKLGQYAKTGLNYASKATKVIIHESMGDGYSVISKARKAVPGKTIFVNYKSKAKVGLDTLKADIKAVANKPGIFAKAKALYKSGVSAASAGKNLTKLQKLAAGTKGIASAVGNSVKKAWADGVASQVAKVTANGKNVTKLTKALGGLKGIAKPLCKAPFLYAATLAIFEGPKIYDAFKNGGFWAGIKETGKVAAGIAVGGALGALGTAVGGPVVGMLAFAAGEQITRSLLGDSESEAAEVKEDDQLAQAQTNGTMPDEVDTQSLRDALRAQSEESGESEESDNKTQEGEQAQPEAQTQNPQGLPATLQPSDTSVEAMMQGSNPFGQQGTTPYTNPFGLDTGSNIFQRFPMGYKFQYQGNGFGMMA